MTSPANSPILWCDEHVVAVNKPPGVSLKTPRSAPREAVARLLEALGAGAARDYGLDPEDLLLVHRLDVGTSGVVLVARDAETHRTLSQALASRRLHRVYLALVWGRPRKAAGCFDARLGPDRTDRRRMCVDPAGRPAVTRFVVRGAGRYASVVELTPETGRTHQLRVHLAHAGHSIVGDDLYGGPRHRGVRPPGLRELLAPTHPFLHSWRVHLPPLGGGWRPEIVTAPPPPDFRAAAEALGLAEALD